MFWEKGKKSHGQVKNVSIGVCVCVCVCVCLSVLGVQFKVIFTQFEPWSSSKL